MCWRITYRGHCFQPIVYFCLSFTSAPWSAEFADQCNCLATRNPAQLIISHRSGTIRSSQSRDAFISDSSVVDASIQFCQCTVTSPCSSGWSKLHLRHPTEMCCINIMKNSYNFAIRAAARDELLYCFQSRISTS